MCPTRKLRWAAFMQGFFIISRRLFQKAKLYVTCNFQARETKIRIAFFIEIADHFSFQNIGTCLISYAVTENGKWPNAGRLCELFLISASRSSRNHFIGHT